MLFRSLPGKQMHLFWITLRFLVIRGYSAQGQSQHLSSPFPLLFRRVRTRRTAQPGPWFYYTTVSAQMQAFFLLYSIPERKTPYSPAFIGVFRQKKSGSPRFRYAFLTMRGGIRKKAAGIPAYRRITAPWQTDARGGAVCQGRKVLFTCPAR